MSRLKFGIVVDKTPVGPPGLSAYEIWLAAGNTGTPADYIQYNRDPTAASEAVAAKNAAEIARDQAVAAKLAAEAAGGSGGTSVEIVNNTTAGGTTKALSAEQGKVLAQSLSTKMRYAGGFSLYTSYAAYSVVTYLDAVYVALSDGTDKIPTDYPLVWKKLGMAGGGVAYTLASNLVDGLMSSANYIRLLAAITSKAEIEAYLSGLITTHYHNTELTESAEDGFFITDSAGAVALKYDSAGFDIAKISPHFSSLISQSQVSNSLWKGKTIAFLGDSITAFAKHVNKYALLTGSTALNYGVGGTRIGTVNTETTSFLSRYLAMSDTADMVIVFGGTNDYGTGAFLMGAFTDRVNNTFYGALHLLCQGLLTKYPHKPIVFMTPLHRADTTKPEYDPTTLIANTNTWSGKTLKEYVQAIKDVCAFYSIPVLDSYSESGLDVTINGAYYFADGLHPTDFGGFKLASYMYPRLESIYNEYYVNNK